MFSVGTHPDFPHHRGLDLRYPELEHLGRPVDRPRLHFASEALPPRGLARETVHGHRRRPQNELVHSERPRGRRGIPVRAVLAQGRVHHPHQPDAAHDPKFGLRGRARHRDRLRDLDHGDLDLDHLGDLVLGAVVPPVVHLPQPLGAHEVQVGGRHFVAKGDHHVAVGTLQRHLPQLSGLGSRGSGLGGLWRPVPVNGT